MGGVKKGLEHLDLSVERKRKTIDTLVREAPVIVACQVLGMARSTYYYQAAWSSDEPRLKEAIKETAVDWPTYSFTVLRRRVHL